MEKHRTVELKKDTDIDETTRQRLQELREHVIQISIESTGRETWDKLTRGQGSESSVSRDALCKASCDVFVTAKMDIVQKRMLSMGATSGKRLQSVLL